ncbi:MAG: outer membrane beta-barrel protein [Sphingomonas sp.]
MSRGAMAVRLLALGATAIGLSAPARAQQTDILSDFHNSALEFPRDRSLETVMERDQPLYDPKAYHFGTLEVMPRVSAETIYDSNIFAVRHSTGDLIARLHPRVDAGLDLDSANIKLAADVDHQQYLGHPSQSTTDVAFGSSLRYDRSRDTSFSLGSRLAELTESRTDPSAPLNTQKPIRYDLASVYVGGVHSFNRLRIAGRLGAERRSYHNGRDMSGAVVDEHFRDRLLLTADAAAEFGLTPDTSFFVDGTINRRDYDAANGTDPPRDSSGYRVTAGANFAASHLIRGQIGLGYFAQNFRSSVYPDVKGLAFRGKLEYLMTPLLTFTLTANRGVEESSTPSVGAYVSTQIGLRADYELLRNLILSATAGYERDRFQGIDRRYSINHERLGAIYKLSPRIWIDAHYDFRNQTSAGSLPGRVFSRHQLMLGVTFQGQ